MNGSECLAAKRLHVITWGCQMNVYDSRRMADVLAPLGYVPVAAPDDADMVILNTCHIRDRAAEKVFSELGRLRRVKDARAAAGGRMILAVAGCVAQAEGAELLARAPFVDIVFGPQTYHRLPEMVARAECVAMHGHHGGDGEADGGGGRAGAVIDTDFPAEQKFDFLPEASAPQGLSAFLTIQEGCDKFCSFCVVPYTRGAEMSRPAAAVLAEARKLVGQGAREIVLLGQNVNAWHGAGALPHRRQDRPASGATGVTTPPPLEGGGWGEGSQRHSAGDLAAARTPPPNPLPQGEGELYLPTPADSGTHGARPDAPMDAGTWGLGRLLRAMAEIPGVLRLRYTTSHPRDMADDLIAAHRDLPMLMPFLHLPVQSGSDRILTAMHRRHSAAEYLRLVDRLRAARPDLALSSDFIVGHPGETEADFADTLALVRAVGFAQAFSFKYSPRPGTPAAGAADQVPEPEKDRRLYELQALLREQQARFNTECVGLTLPVLFSGPGRHQGQVVGRSPFLQPVHMIGPASLIGRELPVHIAAAHTNSLSATPIEERACA